MCSRIQLCLETHTKTHTRTHWKLMRRIVCSPPFVSTNDVQHVFGAACLHMGCKYIKQSLQDLKHVSNISNLCKRFTIVHLCKPNIIHCQRNCRGSSGYVPGNERKTLKKCWNGLQCFKQTMSKELVNAKNEIGYTKIYILKYMFCCFKTTTILTCMYK